MPCAVALASSAGLATFVSGIGGEYNLWLFRSDSTPKQLSGLSLRVEFSLWLTKQQIVAS